MAESVTRFLGEDASLGATIQGLEGRLDGFGQSAAGVGAATGELPAKFAAAAVAVAALAAGIAGAIVSVNTFKTALDFVEKLDNLKSQTGASRAELVLLQRAFDLTGSSAENVGPAINKVQDLIAKAGDNSPKAVEKLNLLGLKFDELNKLSPAQQFEKVMEAIDAIPDPAERARAAMAVFGNSLGRELLPLIKDFDGGLEKASKTLGSLPDIIDRYGPSMSAFNDAIDALKKKPEEFAVGVVGPMSALLGNLAKKFAEFDASGLGEAIGITLNNTLIEIIVWAENVYNLLNGIWDGLSDSSISLVLENAFAAFKKFVEAAKLQTGEIYESLRDADFTQLGKNIATIIEGALADPAQFFEAWWDYMDLQSKEFANLLASLVETSLRTNQLTVEAFVESGFVDKLSDLIYNGLVAAGTKGFEKWAELMKLPVDVLEGLMQAMFLQNGKKLQETLTTAFNGSLKDFAEALNPMGWIGNLFNRVANKFGTDLGSNLHNSVKTFQQGWDATSGPAVDRFWGGWKAEGSRASKEFGAGLSEAGKALVDSAKITADRATFTKLELFDTKQSASESAASFARLAQSAAAVPDKAKQFADNISKAKVDVTSPGGISPALDANAKSLNQTADKTQAASKDVVKNFYDVATSGKEFRKATDGAGPTFAKQVENSGRLLENGIRDAMKSLTDSARGFASETTLRKAVDALNEIKEKINRPVLV